VNGICTQPSLQVNTVPAMVCEWAVAFFDRDMRRALRGGWEEDDSKHVLSIFFIGGVWEEEMTQNMFFPFFLRGGWGEDDSKHVLLICSSMGAGGKMIRNMSFPFCLFEGAGGKMSR